MKVANKRGRIYHYYRQKDQGLDIITYEHIIVLDKRTKCSFTAEETDNKRKHGKGYEFRIK